MTHDAPADAITSLLDATRLNALTTTRSGRIVATTSRPDAKGARYTSALSEITEDTVVRLTRGAGSIGSIALAEDGATYFTARREDENGEKAEDAALWVLPARGEARKLGDRPGGYDSLHLGGGRLFAELSVHSQARGEQEHRRLTEQREKAGVTAILHEGFPVRHWDADLGPSRQVIAVASLPEDLDAPLPDAPEAAGKGDAEASDTRKAGEPAGTAEQDAPANRVEFEYLQMPPGRLTGFDVSEDGTWIVAGIQPPSAGTVEHSQIWEIDPSGGEPRLLVDHEEGAGWWPGAISPDARRVLLERETRWLPGVNMRVNAFVLERGSQAPVPLWPDFDAWFDGVWLDGDTIAGTSDDQGRGAVWVGSVHDAAPHRIAGGPPRGDEPSKLTFSSLGVAGSALVAIASAIDVAPYPVSIDPASGTVTDLPNPADVVEQTGTLTEITATAEDGTPIRAWLRVPEGDGPHPLVVFAHGGPWGSWNAWTYRWNPNPFVEAGYAVLLPDPAISTGYGQHMIDRGQQELGGAPFTDIMALTDAAEARADIDADRTAFAGGSYGGYMANWVAGQTGDRFRCIVTHASLWDTPSMGATTDNGEWGPAMAEQNATYSPSLHAERIQVPVLVIHGDKDYRVPISQGLQLWYDLLNSSATPQAADGTPQHRFLYFPDEGHWILGRGNAEVWYRTVLGFLDRHVRGQERERGAKLG